MQVSQNDHFERTKDRNLPAFNPLISGVRKGHENLNKNFQVKFAGLSAYELLIPPGIKHL